MTKKNAEKTYPNGAKIDIITREVHKYATQTRLPMQRYRTSGGANIPIETCIQSYNAMQT